MARTLTITVDDETMKRVEQIALDSNTDPVEMIGRYLSLISGEGEPIDLEKLPPITRRAYGMLRGMPDKPYKELLGDALEEKYGGK